MRRAHIYAIALPLLALAGCDDHSSSGSIASGKAPAAGESVLLRYKPEEGKTYTITMNTEANSAGQAFTMKLVIDQTIEAIQGGVVTSKATIKEATGTGPVSSFLAQMKGQTFTTKTNERGTVVDAGSLSGSPAGQATSQMKLPEKEVKVGDSWTDTVDSGGMPMTTVSTVDAFEELDGKPVVKTTSVLSTADKSMSGTSVSWVEVATGMPLKTEMKLTGTQNGQPVTMSVTIKTE